MALLWEPLIFTYTGAQGCTLTQQQYYTLFLSMGKRVYNWYAIFPQNFAAPQNPKCRRIYQPTHPNKSRPQNLTTWYRVNNDIRMHTHIIHAYRFMIEAVYARVCIRRPQNLAAFELSPHQTRSEILRKSSTSWLEQWGRKQLQISIILNKQAAYPALGRIFLMITKTYSRSRAAG